MCIEHHRSRAMIHIIEQFSISHFDLRSHIPRSRCFSDFCYVCECVHVDVEFRCLINGSS